MSQRAYPVIDLFAGPGGLGEGFSSFRTPDGAFPLNVKLSIEKEPTAYRTLTLRSFYRQFPIEHVPTAYYDFLRNVHLSESERLSELRREHPEEMEKAEKEAWHAELGEADQEDVRLQIDQAISSQSNWVLIGGPPCQAYSLAGRSRNTGKEKCVQEKDKRQKLYVEYLQILADHAPAVFVMENVKGLLSATFENQMIFKRIIDDLHAPVKALVREGRSIRKPSRGKSTPSPKYQLYSLTGTSASNGLNLSDFVVRMEYYGVPQTRHRVIILGIREDLATIAPKSLKPVRQVNAGRVLAGLPELRSGLSREHDSINTWRKRLREISDRSWFRSLENTENGSVYSIIVETLQDMSDNSFKCDRGAEFINCTVDINYNSQWYLDRKIEGVCNHSTRAHMFSDLHRYFYAACFARANGYSPRLKHFPKHILPNHSNVNDALDGSLFPDRFRVQLHSKPAKTVTSHIAKDGHYYIHPDPKQCRSMSVREAARLQTFPDNYYFCGGRTAQYTQVGNAVPPLLANQLAGIVHDLLVRSGAIE